MPYRYDGEIFLYRTQKVPWGSRLTSKKFSSVWVFWYMAGSDIHFDMQCEGFSPRFYFTEKSCIWCFMHVFCHTSKTLRNRPKITVQHDKKRAWRVSRMTNSENIPLKCGCILRESVLFLFKWRRSAALPDPVDAVRGGAVVPSGKLSRRRERKSEKK